MESCILNQQRVIRATGHVFRVMQFTGNILENNEQYLPRVTSQRSTGKLHGWFHNIGKNHGITRREDNQIFEDSRETQSVFQKVKMWLQYGGNSYPRSHSRDRTGQNRTRKDKSSEGVEYTDKSQGCGKFSWVCKLLPMIYPKFQPYSKAIEWTKRLEGLEIGSKTSKGVWRTQGKYNKSTGTISAQKREKIQSGNKCFRICYRKSAIPGTGWEVETNSIFIKNNATSRKKLWNIWQGATGNSGDSNQVETILTRCIGDIQNLDRPWKSEIFPGTS